MLILLALALIITGVASVWWAALHDFSPKWPAHVFGLEFIALVFGSALIVLGASLLLIVRVIAL